MRRRLVLFSLVLCTVLVASAGFALPPNVPPGQDRAAEMQSQGWARVTDGVMQRKLGGNKVETMAFGREGFEWLVQKLEGRLGFLLNEHKNHPGPELRKIIVDLRRDIAQMKRDLATTDFSTSPMADPIGAEALANCDIQFGAHADAYELTTSQGVGASASSYFRNTCDYWGRADASVYVRATQGGVTTSDSAAQTQEGLNVQASKALTRNGGEDCYSNAWASASSAGLGIAYETSDSNDSCTAPPPTIYINGPSAVFVSGYYCEGGYWTASVSGGTPPYSAINWYRNGYWVGSGSSYYETFCGSNYDWTDYFSLTATVSDSMGRTASGSMGVWIYYSSIGTCELSYSQIICPVL